MRIKRSYFYLFIILIAINSCSKAGGGPPPAPGPTTPEPTKPSIDPTKETPTNPPVGKIDEAAGFFVEVLGEGRASFNMHKNLETFDEPCKLGASDKIIDCYVEGTEAAFYERPMSLHFHVPSTMCTYMVASPFYFVNRKTKLQTATIVKQAEIEKKKVVADATPPKTKADRNGTRLPEDWRPIDEDGAYAARLGIDVSRTIEDFRDYWVSKAGAAARKADWGRTWRKWARRTADDLRQPARSRAGGGIGSDLAEAGQLAASRLREKRESSGDFRLQSGFGIGAETTGAGTLIRQNNHVSGPLVPAGHDGDDTVGDDRRLAGRVR